MKDRAALLPNRRKITYEDGSVDFVTFEYADQPTEVGTVLGKNALLSDAAVAAVGLSQTDPVPSDAFTKLGIFTNAVSSNLFINGGFDIWQRGTSFAAAGYTADRWALAYNGTGATRAVTRQEFTAGQTDVPSNPTYFLRYNQSAAGSGGTYNLIEQRVEGVRTAAGQTVTLSFYAKAASNGSLVTNVWQTFGSGGSSTVYGVEVTHAITAAWQKFTATMTIPSISGKTIGANDYLSLLFSFPKNATFTIDIANVQLNYGSVALPFVPRSYADELRLCQRYYEKSYNQSVAPGATVSTGATFRSIVTGYLLSDGVVVPCVTKRTTPTVSVYSIQNGAAGYATEINLASVFVINRQMSVVAAQSSFDSQITNGDGTPGNFLRFHWVADAEL